VVSAMAGVTDALLDVARNAATEGNVDDVVLGVHELRDRHVDALMIAADDITSRKEALKKLDNRLGELEKVLTGICYIGELTPRSMDYVVCCGERMVAPILSAALKSIGIDSVSLDGDEAGIVTNNTHGDARPLDEAYPTLKERLVPLISEKVPVVAGFMGATKKGVITTLGRGGSDLTASVIGAAMGVDEIWLWKETKGIMTTDPNLVPEARTLHQVSYMEAMELSYFGAKVLHPRALEPAIRHGIPVRVKSTFEPEFEGTLITSEVKGREYVVKAISLIKDIALLNISGPGMIGTPGVAARVFSALASADINVIMISQGSSELNISFIVSEKDAGRAIKSLHHEFKLYKHGEI
ncbi:MAG: aspartate kinase, partial [Methermicoccaceae archaeon]